LPRRLGDDPLSRRRPSPAGAKDAPSAQSAPTPQKTSHNDVFFRRRTEGPQPKLEDAPVRQGKGLGEAVDMDERPEISEVADIVRTAQAARTTQGAEQLARPVPMDESTPPAAEEPLATIGQTPPAVAASVAALEPPPPMSEEPTVPTSSQPQPEPQKSDGFFKRLFGRFGK